MVILRRATEKRWATRRSTVAYRWRVGTTFKRSALAVEERSCSVCDRSMHVCDHRYHALWTFEGPIQVVNRLVRCPERAGRCWGLCRHRHLIHLKVHVRIPALEDGAQLPVQRSYARL